MLNFLSWNTELLSNSWDLSNSAIQSLLQKREKLWFIDVERHVDIQKIQSFVKDSQDDFDNVVVFGMGWSALGLKAILEAAHGKYYNEQWNKTWKNIYILDNIDSETITDVESCINIERTLFCFISKSGTTVEPLSQYLYFRERVQENVSEWQKHFCFIVWENCTMRKKLEEDFPVFLIPENIWGRFSVFTAVGLLPVAFSGVDIGEYVDWIVEVRGDFLSEDIEKNIPLKSALIISELYKNKMIDSSVLFFYSSRLFQVWEWYKQLLAESIWKDGKGITPISSVGASDQHSELQLYQDGPQNKIFTFISLKNSWNSPMVEHEKNIRFQGILDIYQYGTEESLKQEWHPVMWMELPDLFEKTLWKLLYMYMFQIAYLWELLDINAFDQPGVEKSKNFAREKMKQEYWEVDLFHKAFYE